MFRELMPLLKERTVMMTLSRIDDTTIRVCVIPKRLKEDGKETPQENALCAPLAVTGTVDDLDREFGSQLTRYSTSVVALGANFEEIEAAHDAATKALKAENKKEIDRQRGKPSAPKVAPAEKPSGPVIKDGKPVFGSKDGPAPPAETRTLFDAEAPVLRTSELPATAEATTQTINAENVNVADAPSSIHPSSTEEQRAFTYPD
jgi:PRTRC genetic system protein E